MPESQLTIQPVLRASKLSESGKVNASQGHVLLAGLEAAVQQSWADYLMEVGEGRTMGGPKGSDPAVTIRPGMLTAPNCLSGLISDIYGGLEHRQSEPGFLTQRAILAPKNVDVEAINKKVIDMLPGEVGLSLQIPRYTHQMGCCDQTINFLLCDHGLNGMKRSPSLAE